MSLERKEMTKKQRRSKEKGMAELILFEILWVCKSPGAPSQSVWAKRSVNYF
jgi:hypothetical protein